MKTAFVGTSGVTNREHFDFAIENIPWKITGVLCGTRSFVEKCAIEYAVKNNLELERVPRKTSHVMSGAADMFSVAIVSRADALVVLTTGRSHRLGKMLKMARNKKMPIYLFSFSRKLDN